MDRVFLDANVLFSAAYRPSTGLLRLWKLANVTLCTSRYALEEARANLVDKAQQDRLEKISANLDLFDIRQQKLPRTISLPEKDIPIFLAAIESRATYLLTGDVRHIGSYLGKKIEGIQILLPGDYLKMKNSKG
jgi:predicted nucleic acid-binding protein